MSDQCFFPVQEGSASRHFQTWLPTSLCSLKPKDTLKTRRFVTCRKAQVHTRPTYPFSRLFNKDNQFKDLWLVTHRNGRAGRLFIHQHKVSLTSPLHLSFISLNLVNCIQSSWVAGTVDIEIIPITSHLHQSNNMLTAATRSRVYAKSTRDISIAFSQVSNAEGTFHAYRSNRNADIRCIQSSAASITRTRTAGAGVQPNAIHQLAALTAIRCTSPKASSNASTSSSGYQPRAPHVSTPPCSIPLQSSLPSPDQSQ